MKHDDRLQLFYDSLGEISLINNHLDQKRDVLKKHVEAYHAKVQHISIAPSLKNKNKDISILLNKTIETLTNCSSKWVSNFDDLLEKEKFSSDLENSFVVMIFGKVKAGKSTLGNFIAKNSPKPEDVVFFQYDQAGKEQAIKKLEEMDNHSFETDNLECTSAIQGFKLNGMAWVDTPGLGSMVEENGALAKQYIDAADYIIYPTSSDSPVQADEILQLKELFEQHKKVTVCITQSDDSGRRKGEDGKYIRKDGVIKNFPINKPEEGQHGRQVQKKCVRDEIAKINNNQSLLGDVLTISVHTAQLGLDEKNDELFEHSHIPQFYELLTKVVKEKSTQLKAESPANRLISFIDNDVLGENDREFTVKKVREDIDVLEQSIYQMTERLSMLIKNIESDIYQEVHDIVEQKYTEIDQSNSSEIFQHIQTEIEQVIKKIMEANIRELFEDFSQDLNTFTMATGGDDVKIHDHYETYSYSTTARNKAIGRTVFGVIATLGAAVATGGASLALTAVAAITITAGGAGAYLGGKVGGMTGSTHTGRIHVGDNKNEVIQEFKEKQIALYCVQCQKVYTQIQGEFFQPIQAYVSRMKQELGQFEENIKCFKRSL